MFAASVCYITAVIKVIIILIEGRHFHHRVLDMVELGVSDYSSMHDVLHAVADDVRRSASTGTKPVLVFNGAHFVDDPTLNRMRNLFTDFFRYVRVLACMCVCVRVYVRVCASAQRALPADTE